MTVRLSWLLALMLAVAGCGPAFELPEVRPLDTQRAQAEVQAMTRWNRNPDVSDRVARKRIAAAWSGMDRVATALCLEMGIARCTWESEYDDSREADASAHSGGRTIISRGVVELSNGQDDLAFVIAHEMAHHMLGHPDLLRWSATLGAFAGWAVTESIDLLAAFLSPRKLVFADELEMYGRRFLRLAWSRRYESEADYLALLLLYRAGLDMNAAVRRHVVVAYRNRAVRSTWRDSHPQGIERVAQLMRFAAEIEEPGGRLPRCCARWL